MKLIAGLGNPGKKYEKTRHNVGFMALDSFPKSGNFSSNKSFFCELALGGDEKQKIHFVKPTTFMNSSGKAVKALRDYFKLPTDIYIIHDDLDLKLGEYKIQFGTGPKVHNGVNSVEEELKTKDFWRVRIGVDNRDPLNRTPGETYVLENFTDEELATLNEVFIKVKKDLSL